LARWVNAPTTGLQLVRDNITYNHNGILRGRWQVYVRSYRSTLGQVPGLNLPTERTMSTVTMNDNVFVLLEDPLAPIHGDILLPLPGQTTVQPPRHYRSTFVTLSPPNALEQLMAQLKARWVPVRQASGSTNPRAQGGNQLTIDGFLFSIGTDWLVRVGNVVLPGGSIKGMLLEAEYLPLPVLHSPIPDATSELLSNLLASLLPNIPGARTVAVTSSDAQWEDALWDREEEEEKMKREAQRTAVKEKSNGTSDENDDDIFVSPETHPIPDKLKGDWVGVARDRRSAFLIIGALRSEGIL
ncbi:hypothetical protein FISHEDRAFT_41103, partial [Fistulina hepatica ATCC 64428]